MYVSQFWRLESKIKVLADSVSGEAHFLICRTVSSHGEEGWEFSGGPFYKGTNLIHEGSTLTTQSSPQCPNS